MDDLKRVTVSHLRALAQKHLGNGYRKLKKEEWLAALAAYLPALAKLARLAGITVERKSSTVRDGAAKAPEPEPPKAAATTSPDRSTAPKRVVAKRASETPGAVMPARPAQVMSFPPKPRGPRVPQEATMSSPDAEPPVESGPREGSASASMPEPETPAAAQPTAPPPLSVQHEAEPVVEGFFVARVRGEEEARRHHMVEEPRPPASPEVPPEHEGLGGLPGGYQDDSMLLLPRDPYTLFVSWDFSAAARTKAQHGLDSPRAVLRVFDGEKMVRELDCALEARSFYIHSLQPGRPYRVEAHFVGSDGRNRRIGVSSNRIALPPSGTSTDTSIRFLRVPPRIPEPQPLPEVVPPVRARTSEVEEREYITWRRVNLPGSAGVQDLPESRSERTGASEQPDSHLEGPPRAPGASDLRYMESQERAPGASDQRYLEAPGRASGSSEQSYLGGELPRERQYLDVGRVPGASDMLYLDSPGRAPGASDMRYEEGVGPPAGGAWPPPQYLDIGRAPGASDMRYLDSPGHAPGASDMRYLESPGRAPGASDMRYLESPPRASGASDMRYLESPPRAPGASDMRYLESPPRAPGASDMRYLESPPRAPGASDMRYLESPPRAPGASDMRYLESPPRAPGASDMRYLESPPRAPGASDMRYLESPPRAPGASDARYLESPPRAPGASDVRYLEYVARPPGASDKGHTESAPRPQGSAEEPLPRKPPSGSGRS
jgi:hypothetical protein